MKKILVFFIAMLPLHLMAQISLPGSITSPNQQMIEDAVAGSVYVITQQFQLQDTVTGGYFGRGGRQEFGATASLGVKIQGGYLYFDQAERPWEYDSNFDRYRQSHRPVIYKTLFRELSDSLGTEAVSFYSHQAQALVENQLYRANDPAPFSGEGLSIEGTPGEKQGWLVWITSQNQTAPQTEDRQTVSYLIYRKALTIAMDSLEYSVSNPQTQRHVWGGIYVNPVRTAMGQITFKLVGVMVKRGDQWYVVALTGQGQPAAPSVGAPELGPPNEGDDLTPAGVDPALAPEQAPESEDDEQANGKKKKGKKKKNQ